MNRLSMLNGSLFFLCGLTGCAVAVHGPPLSRHVDDFEGSPTSFSAVKSAPEVDHAPQQVERLPRPNASGREMVYAARFRLATGNIEETVRKWLATVDELGGYMESRNNDSVVCRVPVEKFHGLVEKIALFGDVIDQSISAQDVTEEHADVNIRLEAAEASRKRVMALLDRAEKVEEIIKLEEELTKLTLMIEQLQSKNRLMEQQIAYSQIEVTFESRSAVTKNGTAFASSPFPWINRVGAERVVRGFSRRRATKGLLDEWPMTLTGSTVFSKPEGFLVVLQQRRELMAITADESKFWAREFAVDEPASLEFWTDALKRHLIEQRGYKLLEEETVADAEGVKGTALQFEVFSQGRTYLYGITLFPVPRALLSTTDTIRVAEFVATKEQFPRYVAAVESATLAR